MLRQKQLSDLEHPEKQGGKESSWADSKQSKMFNNGTTSTGHRKQREKSRTLNRCWSKQHLCRAPTVQETVAQPTRVAWPCEIDAWRNSFAEKLLEKRRRNKR